MPLRMLVILGMLAAAGAAAAGQSIWDRNAAWMEKQVNACADGTNSAACSQFPARALDRLFGLPDLCEKTGCVNTQQLAKTIGRGGRWLPLGTAEAQENLVRAQQMAAGGLPVVAVQPSLNRVALIMPGSLYPSLSWGRNVPLAATTRTDVPEASLYAKGLSNLFSDASKVALYVYDVFSEGREAFGQPTFEARAAANTAGMRVATSDVPVLRHGSLDAAAGPASPSNANAARPASAHGIKPRSGLCAGSSPACRGG